LVNLSVIIPHYNKNEALQETWKELMLQIDPEDEIIVVDDYSDVKPDFDCPCTRTIQPPKHIPLPPKHEKHIYRLNTLRNYGVEHATHDACIILDPDCVPSVGFINHARKIYDPSVLFSGRITRKNEAGDIVAEDRRMVDGKSKWGDATSNDCHSIFGGCMYFSKQRASLAASPTGLFDTDFDGNWGYEEHAFASACRNSGMRLRLEAGLTVCHLWHPHIRFGAPSRNKNKLQQKIRDHHNDLNYVTFYKPAVVVLMVSAMHPNHVDRGMRSIFRHMIPLKVRLVNNGDLSSAQRNAVSWWNDRWAVDYIEHETPQPLSTIQSDAVMEYTQKGYKYLVTMDDNVLPKGELITSLISEMEKNPKYHVLSGCNVDENGEKDDEDTSHFQIIRLNETTIYPEEKKHGQLVGFTGKKGMPYQRIMKTGVLLVTMMRPVFLEQCLSRLALVKTPIRVYLVNQADKSEETMAVIDKWRNILSMTYKENQEVEGLAAMKRWGMEQMKADGLDYIIIVDDDICLRSGSLENLVICADAHPEFHSIAGWLEEGRIKSMLGGNSRVTPSGTRYPRLAYTPDLKQVEWVGGGFTLHRLDPLVLHDPAYMIGLEDYDYANELKKLGLKSAVTGTAGAWHKMIINGSTMMRLNNSSDYQGLRMSGQRIQESKVYFKNKWGYGVI